MSRGRLRAATTLDSDTIRLKVSTARKMPKQARPTGQETPSSMPRPVATGLGMLLGLTWPVGLACFGIFLAVLTFSRIVSLSSVVAALSLPLLMLGWFGQGGLRPAYLLLAVLTTVLVIWRHRSNLQRLLAGQEPRLGAAKKADAGRDPEPPAAA